MLEVKFGTVRPVSFREFDENYKYTDLVVDARMAGIVFVSDYDRERYKDDDAVTAFIKSNATDIMQKSLDDMPAGKSIVKSDKSGVADQFAAELLKTGITARAEIKLFSLLPESEEKLGNLFKFELMAEKSTIKPYGIIPGEADADAEREPGTFKVNFGPSVLSSGFSSEKRYYAPGENVEVFCKGIPGDTKCFFFANAESYKVHFENGSQAKIIFVMPEHDVDVLVTMEKQRFGPIPYEKRESPEGFMNLAVNTAQKESEDAGEWLCVYCGTANNHSQFCTECGRPNPLEWKCPSCMCVNKGGNKCLSCGRPRLPYGFLG